MRIHYDKKLKQLSRNLRNKSTLSEVLLWKQLKGKQIRNYQFMRQKPIANFIVDFYCSSLKLIIEIDGESHNLKGSEDVERQRKLELLGITIMRFTDIQVKQDMRSILYAIDGFIENFEKTLGDL